MNAVRSGQAEVVEIRLREGADVDAISNTGQTALKLAADTLRKDFLAVLREYGAHKQQSIYKAKIEEDRHEDIR